MTSLIPNEATHTHVPPRPVSLAALRGAARRQFPWAALALGIATSVASTPEPAASGTASPWRQVVDPEEVGWSAEALETARQHAEAAGTAAFLLVQGGVVVAAWGAVDLPLKAHSIRKSLYSVTFGPFVEGGTIDLDATLSELGIDDLEGLSADEQMATVRDLLASRSGVYHRAAYETESAAATRPERGSAAAGASWYYNNWDFNVLPAIFEAKTGNSIEEAFLERIATPLGMEDFDAERDVFSWLEPTVSRYPAIAFRISARDLARVGCLLLDDGAWDGVQVIPESWVAESTSPQTVFPAGHQRGEGNGYAYLWWTMPAHPDDPSPWRRVHRIAALGAGGHGLFVVPSLDLVLVHRTNTETGQGLRDRDAIAILEEVLAARIGEPRGRPHLGPLAPVPIGEPPRIERARPLPVSPRERAALGGAYLTDEGNRLVVFEHEGRLFARREADFASEAEIFAEAPGRYFSPLAPLRVAMIEEHDGRATKLSVSLFGRTATANRVE